MGPGYFHLAHRTCYRNGQVWHTEIEVSSVDVNEKEDEGGLGAGGVRRG